MSKNICISQNAYHGQVSQICFNSQTILNHFTVGFLERKNLYRNLFIFQLQTDSRIGFCFEKFDENGCTTPKTRQMRKSVCCCTMGAGWGDPCELCPQKNTCKQRRLLRRPLIVSLGCRKGSKYTTVAQTLERRKGSSWGGGGGGRWCVPLPWRSFVQVFARLTAQESKQYRY